MLAMSEAKKLGGFQDINACYGERPHSQNRVFEQNGLGKRLTRCQEVSAAQLCSPSLPALLQLF